MLLTKKRLHKIKKSKQQSRRKYQKGGKRRKYKKNKHSRRRSFRKRKKALNLRRKSLKKSKLSGGNRDGIMLAFPNIKPDSPNTIDSLSIYSVNDPHLIKRMLNALLLGDDIEFRRFIFNRGYSTEILKNDVKLVSWLRIPPLDSDNPKDISKFVKLNLILLELQKDQEKRERQIILLFNNAIKRQSRNQSEQPVGTEKKVDGQSIDTKQSEGVVVVREGDTGDVKQLTQKGQDDDQQSIDVKQPEESVEGTGHKINYDGLKQDIRIAVLKTQNANEIAQLNETLEAIDNLSLIHI